LVSMAPTQHSIVDYMNCSTFHMFMNVFVLAMCCLKHVNMLWMMTKILWAWGNWVWKMPKQVYKKNYLDKKNPWKGGRIGENIYRTGLFAKKLKTFVKTRFTSKIIMFEKCFEFKKIILICYNKQKLVTL